MRYHFRVKKEGRGYWAQCVELEGCRTQGDTREELDENMQEALNLYLDEPEDSRAIYSLPKRSVGGKNVVEVQVEPKVALAFQLRMLRLRKHLTQKQAADLIGLKGLYSYQRLESSKTANPEYVTLVRIKKAFPEFDLEKLVS